jgi:hypothetical protein
VVEEQASCRQFAGAPRRETHSGSALRGGRGPCRWRAGSEELQVDAGARDLDGSGPATHGHNGRTRLLDAADRTPEQVG